MIERRQTRQDTFIYSTQAAIAYQCPDIVERENFSVCSQIAWSAQSFPEGECPLGLFECLAYARYPSVR
jgi:hypothetical protein